MSDTQGATPPTADEITAATVVFNALNTMEGQAMNAGGPAAIAKIASQQADILTALATAARSNDAELLTAAVQSFHQLQPYMSTQGAADFLAPLQKLLEACKTNEVWPAAMHCHFRLGILLRERGEPANAKQMHESGLAIANNTNNQRWQGIFHQRLGDVALDQNQLDMAENHYNTAFTLLSEQDNSFQTLGSCLYGLGAVAKLKGDPETAAQRFNGAIEQYGKAPFLTGIGDSKSALAEIELARGQFVKAEVDFNEARKSYEQGGNRGGIGNCVRGLGDVALQQNRFEDAKRYYEEAATQHYGPEHRAAMGLAMLGIGRANMGIVGTNPEIVRDNFAQALELLRPYRVYHAQAEQTVREAMPHAAAVRSPGGGPTGQTSPSR